MRKYITYIVVVAALVAGISCMKTATDSSNAKDFKGSPPAALLGKWQYVYYASCPSNPLMGAPCYEYSVARSTSSTLCLNFGDSLIYRSADVTLNNFPISWVYGPHNDTLHYKVISDSAIVLLDAANEVTDTVKIKTADKHSLVLDYASKQLGIAYERDSLIR